MNFAIKFVPVDVFFIYKRLLKYKIMSFFYILVNLELKPLNNIPIVTIYLIDSSLNMKIKSFSTCNKNTFHSQHN